MPDFSESPIIAAVRTDNELKKAVLSEAQTIFLLHTSLTLLDEQIEKTKKYGKNLFVHIDFVDGLSKDASGVDFLATRGIDGLISTRTACIHAAKENRIECIQRFFMVDSRSLDTALESVRQAHPDMIEIMPGIAFKAIERMTQQTDVPVIAGGLIESKDEIYQALRAGASAVSTGKETLWNL